MSGRYAPKLNWKPNGRGRGSRARHRANRAAVKLSDAYLAKRRAFEAAFLSMMPVSGAPASALDQASAVMGATPVAGGSK